jgi:hypothetical protein
MSVNPVAAAAKAALERPKVIVRQSAPEEDALKSKVSRDIIEFYGYMLNRLQTQGQQDGTDKMFWQPMALGDRTAQEAADALLAVRIFRTSMHPSLQGNH